MTIKEMVKIQFPDSSEDFASQYGRTIRNNLLSSSDWTQVADAPVDSSAWAQYRQELRDLPSDPSWPNVELPIAPES